MKLRHFLAAGLLVAWLPVHAAAETALAPYQMVRSLQVLQDRIADGDHAALPMQNKLLEMIDKRFRDATDADFEDRRNFRAMLVYGMSGGNPVTLEMLTGRLHLATHDQQLALGVSAYLTGRLRLAQTALKTIDAGKLRPELGAFLALVQGSLMAAETPLDALRFLDQARLLGPGTLVEEAALRRTLSLAATLKQVPRFQRTAEQYVRRFIRSPYASQFVDDLLGGIVALDQHIDRASIASTIALMTPEQQRFVYLKLARISAIENLADLNAFAAEKARSLGGVDGEPDPRALLYSAAPEVTSETVDQTLARLKQIDRSRLSENDRLLLDAAEAIANSVTSPAAALSPAASAPEAEQPQGEPEVVQVSADPSTDTRGSEAADGGHMDILTSARAKLDAVDALLERSAQ
ncbi:MAG TPA: chemotaxis protein [Tianweitania sediminis]|jgi:chemotaxis protein MotC|nr:chemotaxis protein [Tianweitania sediminis]